MLGLKQRWIAATKRPDSDMHPHHMEWFGVNNLNRAAKIYNTLRLGSKQRARRRAVGHGFTHLIAENGIPTLAPPVMNDGWVIDDSHTLPHLDRMLAEAEAYIAEFGGKPRTKSARGFIKDILDPSQVHRFRSFVDFATSSEVLTTVSNYLGYVPLLSDTVPPGIRLVESTANGQLEDGIYRQSQLYHLDFHDKPLVYVIVLLRDVTTQSGPFTFLSASVSDKAARKLRYGKRGVSYRVADDAMYGVIDRAKDEIAFTYPRGTVLFLDSSRCFHFGSRDAVVTRYQMMYAYVSPCRTDFAEQYMAPIEYPIATGCSRLRRMVLDASYTG